MQFDGDGRCFGENHPPPPGRSVVAQLLLLRRRRSSRGVGQCCRSIRYECDAAHRLVRAELPGQQVQVFERDLAGNLLTQPGLNNVVVMEGNRLASANGDRFEYNERNHIAVRTGRSGTARYFYDSTDMLISIQMADIHWDAEYDAPGAQNQQDYRRRETDFFWDNLRISTSPLMTSTTGDFMFGAAAGNFLAPRFATSHRCLGCAAVAA